MKNEVNLIQRLTETVVPWVETQVKKAERISGAKLRKTVLSHSPNGRFTLVGQVSVKKEESICKLKVMNHDIGKVRCKVTLKGIPSALPLQVIWNDTSSICAIQMNGSPEEVSLISTAKSSDLSSPEHRTHTIRGFQGCLKHCAFSGRSLLSCSVIPGYYTSYEISEYRLQLKMGGIISSKLNVIDKVLNQKPMKPIPLRSELSDIPKHVIIACLDESVLMRKVDDPSVVLDIHVPRVKMVAVSPSAERVGLLVESEVKDIFTFDVFQISDVIPILSAEQAIHNTLQLDISDLRRFRIAFWTEDIIVSTHSPYRMNDIHVRFYDLKTHKLLRSLDMFGRHMTEDLAVELKCDYPLRLTLHYGGSIHSLVLLEGGRLSLTQLTFFIEGWVREMKVVKFVKDLIPEIQRYL